MCRRELAQRYQSPVAVDRYTDPIDWVIREKRLSRMEKMRTDTKSCVLCDERNQCACVAQSVPVRPPSALA